MSTSSNRITKVAIVGASGRSGSFILQELLKTGQHTLTALTRSESKATLPKEVLIAQIDYSSPSSLTNALRDQDVLIITMSTSAPKTYEEALIRAAGKAGVKFLLPNEWGPDTAHEGLVRDVPLFAVRAQNRELIEREGGGGGGMGFIGVSTGFWYEWSLGIEDAFGFDFQNKRVTFFDEGLGRICTSTWTQVGRGVAGLLSLPVESEGEKEGGGGGGGGGRGLCLEDFKNKMVYISSFTVCQKEMFESVLRVTGTKEEEWDITYQSTAERFSKGIEKMQKGDRKGLVQMMYSRVFFKDGCGDVESSGKGTVNELLGLPKEDIDAATRVAIQRAGGNPWA